LTGCFVAEIALEAFIESGDIFFDFGGEIGVGGGTCSSWDNLNLKTQYSWGWGEYHWHEGG
jgi:hypothetical protein